MSKSVGITHSFGRSNSPPGSISSGDCAMSVDVVDVIAVFVTLRVPCASMLLLVIEVFDAIECSGPMQEVEVRKTNE